MRGRLADVGVMAACWAFVAFLSTAQHWTGLDTPDSEFYATLGLFGHDVTDRAVLPVYYWTRLGTIAPVRALTEALGPWTGYHVFWLLLLAVVICALYLMARRFTGRTVSALLATLVALNTVILGYLGNPYPTGTAFAAMLVVIGGAVWTIPTERGPGRAAAWIAPAASGLAVGWLAMTNPYATLLSTTVWCAATLAVLTLPGFIRWQYAVRSLGMLALGAGLSFGALLVVSGILFPGLDWLGTYRYWNSALNQADYIGDMLWFTRDVSMIVPAVIGASLVVIAVIARGRGALRVAAVLFPASAAFALGYLVVVPSNTLETPHYQSMQWPPALAGLVLTVAAIIGRRPLGWVALVVGGGGVLATILAGHWVGVMPLATGWVIALTTAAILIAAAAWAWHSPTGTSAVCLLVAVCIVMTSAQFLQNGRRPLGVNAEDLYSNAFQPNDVEAKLRSAYDAEAWLISQTTPTDKVMVWVDADWASREQALLPMAAFQIWGANSVTQQRSLGGDELEYVKGWAPSVIALYGKSMDAVVAFWSSLPRELRGPAPVCREYPWPNADVPTAHVCLMRPTWS